MLVGAARGVYVGEGVWPGRRVLGFEDCVGVVTPPAKVEPPLPLLEGDVGVVDPLPSPGPTVAPPEDDGLVEGFATDVVVETMVVVMYVLVMYVVGASLIVTVSPLPKRFTICEAD